VVLEESKRMIDHWEAQPLGIDVEHEMRGLTASVMMRVIFGELGPKGIEPDDAKAVIDATAVQLESSRSPTWLTKLARMAGVKYNHLPHVSKEIRQSEKIINDVLDKTLAARRANGPRSGDILDQLIAARDPETGAPFPDRQIKDNLLMFIVAGHETTAVALTFALYELLRNPHEIDVIRAEIDSVVPPGAELKPEHYARLPRLRVAFRESQRLHPSAYEIGRESRVDEIIPAGGALGDVEIKKGDLLLLDLRKMHRSPEYFDDPDAYKPARFGPYPRTSPRGFMPFGADVRVCLAPNMAEREAVLALADIFRRVNLKVKHWPAGEVPAFTMRLDGHLKVEASGRSPC
jgi:cytochrome P450